LAEGASLDNVLAFLIKVVERHCAKGILAAITPLNESGTHFQRGIGASLPEAFNVAVEGPTVSSPAGLCASALRRGEAVAVRDFNKAAEWRSFGKFVAPYGLRSGWSTPIISSGGQMLGTFANYYRHACDPVPRNRELVEMVVRTAAIAIERTRATEALRSAQAELADRARQLERLVTERTGQLHETIERVDLILASISDQFFGLSKDWRFTYFNQHAAEQMKLLGKDPQRLIGKVLWEEFPEMPNEAALRRVMSERVVVTDEFYYALLGEWVENHMYPSHDGGLVIFQRYITARKQTEEELLRAQTELAHVTRITTMGEMAASIAHEINQPLGAIVHNSSACLLLFGKRNSREEISAALSDIVSDASRASTIITRVRALTKRSIPEMTSLAMNDVLADVLAVAHRALFERRITVQTQVPEELPRVSGDRVQLQQVLLNLVMNAIEAMIDVEAERRVLTIETRLGELDGKAAVVMSVHDQGHGFRSAEMEKLFQPFYTTKKQGMGMGLRISRSIAEAHGGSLWVTANSGPGATFFLALPAL
jgi:C4-dicarboxylate-specific signal transduction histidine kinase